MPIRSDDRSRHPWAQARRRAGRQDATVRRVYLALLLVGLACGPNPAAVSPRPADPPVTVIQAVSVGAVVSLSGRWSREGSQLRAGYEAWAHAANEAGGIRVGETRRPVRLEVRDDGSEPLSALQVVESLIRDEGITLLLGPHSSPITLAAATVAERLAALMVAPDASSPHVYARGLRGLVSVLPTDDTLFHGLVELADAVSPRARPLALVLPDQPPYGTAAEGAAGRARELALGEPMVELYPPGTPDLTPILERVALARPRLLVLATERDNVRTAERQLRELRFHPPMHAIFTPAGATSLLDDDSNTRNGLLTVDWWSPSLRASGALFGSAANFASRFEREAGYRPTPRVAAAAAAGVLLQLGVERAAADDPAAVRAALAGLDATTFWGRITPDQAGRNRAGRPPVLQMRGGQWSVVFPPAFAGMTVLYPAQP